LRFHREEDEAARLELAATWPTWNRTAIQIIRASVYFSHLANIAEDPHHIPPHPRACPGGIGPARGHDGLCARPCESAEVPAPKLKAFFDSRHGCPVPHRAPHGGQRRSTMDREMDIARLLATRDRARPPRRSGGDRGRSAPRRADPSGRRTAICAASRLRHRENRQTCLDLDYTFLRELRRFYAESMECSLRRRIRLTIVRQAIGGVVGKSPRSPPLRPGAGRRPVACPPGAARYPSRGPWCCAA